MALREQEAPAAIRKSHVGEQHDTYKELVKELHESIGILRAHLEPVLNNHAVPSQENIKSPNENLVPLAASLRQINSELKDGIFNIKDICNSLEI